MNKFPLSAELMHKNFLSMVGEFELFGKFGFLVSIVTKWEFNVMDKEEFIPLSPQISAK